VVALVVSLVQTGGAQERPFPYRLTDRDWVIGPVALAAGSLGVYLVGRLDPITLEEIVSLDRRSVNRLDRGTTYNWSEGWQDGSDWPRDVLLGASVLLSGAPLVMDGRWDQAVTVGTMFVETAALTAGVTYIVKALTKRTRPYAYNTSLTPEERYAIAGPDDASIHQSFFSGHTSSAFAAATLMSTLYSDVHGSTTKARVLWASSLSLAALTAYARVKGGVHFPTDVLAGAAAGMAIGYVVPVLHRRDAGGRLGVSLGPGLVQVRLALGGDPP
jgi:membrane-associated phospholipid phosphatase